MIDSAKARLFGIKLRLNGKLAVSKLFSIYLVCLSKQEICEDFNWVLRNFLAQVN
jgi:hypothetical protein